MALWAKKTENEFNQRLQNSIDEPEIDQRIELLEVEVASLKRKLKELETKFEILSRFAGTPGEQKVSNEPSENQRIYEAFDQGKSLVEIAQEFNKGKGEIQLILNLRNLK